MQRYALADMKGGWFVGDFTPSCLPLKECEVAVKRYRAGETEARHVHRISTELTLVVSGRVQMNREVFREGEIIVLSPGEPGEFHVLEDAITVVVKSPSIPSDKYVLAE